MKLYIEYSCNDRHYKIDTDIDKTITYSDENMGFMVNRDKERISLKVYPDRLIEMEKIELYYERDFSLDDRLFFNGYQGWSYSHEDDIYTKKKGFNALPTFKRIMLKKYHLNRYGDYDFAEYPNKTGYNHSWSYLYIRNGRHYKLFGSLNENFAFTRFIFDSSKKAIIIVPDIRGYKTNQSFVPFDFCILDGDEDEVFDKWFSLMHIEKPTAKPVLGYTSWYNHYQDINEEKIINDFNGIRALPERINVFQIDDGWETRIGDWLDTDRTKFPNGLKGIVNKIHANDLLAGLWLAPFSAECESELFKQHPDWMVKDDKGEPYICGCNWSSFYGLDIYNEEVREYLRQVFDKVFNEWGFDLVKLDFLYSACALNRPDKPRGKIMADGMDLLRELCGDKLILGCGVPLASAFGKVDYCRIGCDVSLEYDDVFYMRRAHPERTSTRHCMVDTIYRRQLDGRAFLNDPDVFILRDENVKMTAEQKETLAIINGLFGSVLFMSDDASLYDDAKKKLYKKIVHLKGKAREVDYQNGEAVVVYDDNGTDREIRIKK